MAANIILAFCAQALFIQSVLSQCTSRAAVAADPSWGEAGFIAGGAYGLGAYGYAPNLGSPYGYMEPAFGASCGLGAPWGWAAPALDFSPTSGGALPVSSSSLIPPTGISVLSENIYEGPLAVAGELPFVGTVALDGVLPSYGSGAINHACGNGFNAMVSDISAFAPGYTGAYGGAYAPGIAPALGYRAEWADNSCGCAW